MTVSKFKVGDRVYAPFHKYGTIVEIVDTDASYPITVRWDESRYKPGVDLSTFTEDGFLFFGDKRDWTKITVVGKAIPKDEEEEEEMGQIAGVIQHSKVEKSMAEERKFETGDPVWSFFFGSGIVTRVSGLKTATHPVVVKWTDNARFPNTYNYFTIDGHFYYSDDEAKDITPLDVIDLSKDDGVADRMMDALDKKTDDAINPAHYKVKGIPEAHEIINHLMHMEQYEGFLWGNILKYAYRFGLKGDKAETAGKIEWYAKQLKDLEEEGERK